MTLMGLLMQIGADHMDVKIDPVVNAMAMLLSGIIGHTPRFRVSMGPFTALRKRKAFHSKLISS